MHCLLETNKPVIRLSDYPGYVYLIENEESITHKVSLNTLNRFLEGYKNCGNLIDEYNSHDVEQELFNSFINMAIFILIKLDDVMAGIKILYDFEKSLPFDIVLNSKPLNLINSKIMNKQFMQAKILLMLMGLLYNNKKIKNYIFINYSDLKLLGEN